MEQIQKTRTTKKAEEVGTNDSPAKRSDEQDELLAKSEELLDDIDELLDDEPEQGTMAHIHWLIKRYMDEGVLDLPCGCS